MMKYGPKKHGQYIVKGELSQDGMLNVGVVLEKDARLQEGAAHLQLHVENLAGFFNEATAWLSHFDTEVVVWARNAAKAWRDNQRSETVNEPGLADKIRQKLRGGK